jgi:hypothetical protein
LRAAIDATGTPLAFVHAGTADEADTWFARVGLTDVPRVADPTLAHYRAFGLASTRLQTLLHPLVWARGAASALRHGFGGQPTRLVRQLPGVFVVKGPTVLSEFRHASPADRPDYLGLIRAATQR